MLGENACKHSISPNLSPSEFLQEAPVGGAKVNPACLPQAGLGAPVPHIAPASPLQAVACFGGCLRHPSFSSKDFFPGSVFEKRFRKRVENSVSFEMHLFVKSPPERMPVTPPGRA